MRLIEIPEKKIKFYLPEDLSECDSRQYIEVSALLFLLQTGQMSYEEFRIHAIYKITGMKAVVTNKEDLEKSASIYQFSELMDSFFEEQTPEEIQAKEPKTLKQYYIHNPIPKFLGNFKNYFGPNDDFNKVSFGEYFDMLEEFINFNQTNDMIYLSRLLAVAYRKKKMFSNKKQPYSVDEISKTAKLFQNQHIGIVWGFYLYFASFNKYLSTCKIVVQGVEVDFSIIFSSSEKSEDDVPGLGMKSVMIDIAESGVFGDKDKVRDADMWEILIFMYHITAKNMNQQKETKL